MSRIRPRIAGARTLRVGYLLSQIPDAAPATYKNALAIRNAATVEGRCPDCGAEGELAGPDKRGFLHLIFLHEHDCGVRSGTEDG